MMKIRFLVFLLFFITNCYANENVFYALRYHSNDRMCPPEHTLASLKKNYQKIDIFIPQAYSLNASGEVNNEAEKELLLFAQAHHMKIMPLVTNEHFSKEVAHEILSNATVQTKIIKRLVELCEQNHFYGLQLDFEMVAITDRNALTGFYANVASALHQAGFAVSYAVAPVVTDKPISLFIKKIYENWEGAYDLKALGESGDFISIMAYNQHGGITTPGPAAGLTWTEQAIKYALQYVPANKISIGIPAYSMHGYTGQTKVGNEYKIATKQRGINYEEAMKLLREKHASVNWNKQSAMHYGIFENNWLYEYVFVEDASSFKHKNLLAEKYHLLGISVFDLGTEDPAIWKIISSRKAMA